MKSLLPLAFILAACGGASKPALPPAEPVDDGAALVAADLEDQIAYMTRFGDEACACADAACAQAVDDRLRPVLVAEVHEDIYSDEDAQRYSPAFEQRLAEAYGHYVRCLTGKGVVPYSLGALAGALLEKIEAKTCACTDVTCAREQERAFDRWMKYAGTYPGTQADIDAASQSMVRFAACLDQAYAASGMERGQDGLIAMKELRTRACACADDTCRGEIVVDYEAWVADYGQTTVSARVQGELVEIAKELGICVPVHHWAKSREALARVQELRDRACACDSDDCADAVKADFAALSEDHAHTKGSDDSIAAFAEAFGEMNACFVDRGVQAVPPPT